MNIDSQSSRTDDSVAEVFFKYSDTVFRIAYARTNNSFDAEDIVQDVFCRYIRKKPQFQNQEHEKAWFIRAALNCTISLLTSSWFKKTNALTDDLSTTMEEKSEVYYAVAKLPSDMRVVVHLFYYEDYKVKEIAAILKKTESSVKSLLMRARQKLAALLRTERDDFYEVSE